MNKFQEMFYFLSSERGENLSSVARACGISKSSLSQMLKAGDPKASNLKSLAEHFGVSMEYLLLGEESRDPGQLAVSEDAVAYRIRRKERLNEILSRFEALNDQLSDLLDEDGKPGENETDE